MMYLPEDITRQILLRLPVKSLLRLTCVCKTWRYLILSRRFIVSHTKFGHRMEIVLSSGKNYFSGDREFRISDHMILESHLQSMALSKTLPLKDNYRVIGHCNGIICLEHTRPATILLWNPAIRQARALPPADHYYTEGSELYHLGFGYDAWNQDYKVVAISWDHSNLMTYSLKKDSWKSMNNFSLKLGCAYSIPYACGLFFKGCLYWICVCIKKDELGKRIYAYCLLVFDLNKEEFLEFDLSDTFIDGKHGIANILGIFRGCISVLIQRQDCEAHSFEIWSLKDHFIPQSWTRVVDRSSMALAVDKKFLASLGTRRKGLKSIGLTRDGKIFADLVEDRESYLFLYNVETQKMDVHNRKEDRTNTIDWHDISNFRRNLEASALIKRLGAFRWFVVPDFVETLVAVMPKVNPSPMCA